MLKHEDAARRYALSFKGGRVPALDVLIWEPCVDALAALLVRGERVEATMGVSGFRRYESSLRTGFGFDGALRACGIEDGYLRLRATFKPRPQALAESLVFLFHTLRYGSYVVDARHETPLPADSRFRQLMEVSTAVIYPPGLSGAPIDGVVAPLLRKWLIREHWHRTQFPEVYEVMRKVWNAMSDFKVRKPRGGRPGYDFTARLGDGGNFVFTSLGNACDIGTYEWWQNGPDSGHDIGCHNVDTPIQQLTLIAGLAALHDLARKDLDILPPS
jgi:hypothetical protein